MDSKAAVFYSMYAEAFRYPLPGSLKKLAAGLAALPVGSDKQPLAAFVEQVGRLTLGEWEELYTRTLDMNPPAAPYIGFQIWGESYQRGEFLAHMSREIIDNHIDPEGELPDHLIPVLRYLARADQPIPELTSALQPALQRMIAALGKVESANPYLILLNGILTLSKNRVAKEAA